MNPGAILSMLFGVIGACWLGIAGGWAVWKYDRGAMDQWSYTANVLVFSHTFRLPESIGGQLADLKAREKAAEAHSAAVAASYAANTENAARRDQAAQKAIIIRYRTLKQEIPVYVPPATDRDFPVSWGVVRLFDAGATGLDVSAFPLSAGQSDDGASPVEASELAAAIVDNDAAARANAQQLSDLQNWIRAEGDVQ